MDASTFNSILWIVYLLIQLSLIALIYKYFGKTGLIVWIAIAVCMANMQATKLIDVFGLHSISMGNIIYASIFLSTDVLSEFYGKKTANKAIKISILVQICFILINMLVVLFKPSADDFIQDSYQMFFDPLNGIAWKFAVASLITYSISQTLDIYLYHKIKLKVSKYLWLRNNLSTIISQFLDSILFSSLIFLLGVWSFEIAIINFIVMYIFKMFIAFADTLFIYLIAFIHKNKIASK